MCIVAECRNFLVNTVLIHCNMVNSLVIIFYSQHGIMKTLRTAIDYKNSKFLPFHSRILCVHKKFKSILLAMLCEKHESDFIVLPELYEYIRVETLIVP